MPAIPQDRRVGNGLVALLLQALVAQITDQAFVQDVVARDLRGAVPGDQCERIQRHRRGADIGDFVVDGEKIAVVDRNRPPEGETVAIVIFQRHRAGWRQAVRTLLLPERFPIGKPDARTARGNPAKFCIIGICRARRRKQHDRRRRRVDRLAELRQRQIVDPGALQCDAAGEARGVDLDARRCRDRGLAVDDRRRGGRLIGRGRAGR
jgi:hypothetical protein